MHVTDQEYFDHYMIFFGYVKQEKNFSCAVVNVATAVAMMVRTIPSFQNNYTDTLANMKI